jgi:Fungal chitosanase of glycosyl hydrolase group 75
MAYAPAPEMLPALSNAAAKLANAGEVSNDFDPKPVFLGRLNSGELFFDSELQLDTDGWPEGEGRGDPDWKPDTSLRLSDGSSLNANQVPYFVLPLNWPAQFGIGSGDYAAVLFKTHLAFAVFGDSGPPTKIGEGSIELLRRLGQERIRPNGTVINAGMGPRVLTIVFPGSGDRIDRTDQRSVLAAVDRKGQALFDALRA